MIRLLPMIFAMTLLPINSFANPTDSCHRLEPALIALQKGELVLSAQVQPQRIVISQPFSLLVNICQANKPYTGELIFNATMPKHKHGMNYQASVTQLGHGRYRVQGSLLHMPGLWHFHFKLPQSKQTLVFPYELH